MAESIEKLKQKNEALEKALEMTALEKESLERELEEKNAVIEAQENKLAVQPVGKMTFERLEFTYDKKRYYFPYPVITISGTSFDGNYKVADLVRDKKMLSWVMDNKPGAARLIEEPEAEPKNDFKKSKK